MNKQNSLKQIALGTLILLIGAVSLCAQDTLPPPPTPPTLGAPGGDVFFFSRMEGASPDKNVKGSPYSAQAITEMTQTLSDGNQIHHKSTATLYRDSEGRTRREQTLGGFGPWSAPNNKLPEIIRISDPVAGVSYILNPDEHVAQKMPAMGGGRRGMLRGRGVRAGGPPPPEGGVRTFRFAAPPPAEGEEGPDVQYRVAGGGGPGFEWHTAENSEDVQTEPLGSKEIEGVQAEGTRRTVTIPAGQIGNDKPIHIVTERWFSNKLQAVVLSKRSDPRVGETVYRLTNISQAEPAETLFQVPPGYTVRAAPPFRWESSEQKPKANQ